MPAGSHPPQRLDPAIFRQVSRLGNILNSGEVPNRWNAPVRQAVPEWSP